MSKERLKEIQEKYDMWANGYNLTPQDVECLIKQAELGISQQEQFHDYQTQSLRIQERVRELEKENKLLRFIAEENKIAYEQKVKQNKRYREELEELRAMAIDNIDTEQEISPYLLRDICEEILEDEE